MLSAKIPSLFFEKLNIENIHYIKTREALYTYLNNISHQYSSSTADAKLKAFEKNIFFCRLGRDSMYSQAVQEQLSLSIELIHVHELMYHFLRNNNYLDFELHISGYVLESYIDTKFSWNIPDVIMPFITVYILASAKLKAGAYSAQAFFTDMDRYFEEYLASENKINCFNIDNLHDLYLNWTADYLGRQYFCTLDRLYETYTRNPEQKQVLRDSVRGLTYLLLDCSCIHPSPIPTYMNTLLKQYENALYKESHTNTDSSIDLEPLYKHDSPFYRTTESERLLFLSQQWISVTNELLNFTKEYLKTNHIMGSKYELTIQNPDSFFEQCSARLSNLKEYTQEFESKLCTFFDELNANPDVTTAVNDGRLTFNLYYKEKHIQTITNIIRKYSDKIDTRFKTFSKYVRYASNACPENHKTLTLGRFYLNELEDDFSRFHNSLAKEIQNAFKDLPPVFYFHNIGYIQKHAYPLTAFEEKDTVRIIFELSQKPRVLSHDYIIHYLQSKGIHFPLIGNDFIYFLNNFDSLIDKL